ncbi:hypothetical protein ACQB6R_06510 [Propionibacteriaceae bacterium G1746]|uniref:hypothetical protein n=1 Tax=Aestuariimicrobium sp. G57 TaxID=3418485 RepID=UPI003C21D9AF
MPIQINRRTALVAAAGAGGAAAFGGLVAPTAAAAPDTGVAPTMLTLVDLGEPVHKVQTLSSIVVNLPDGTPLGVYVGAGNATTNAELVVTNLRTEATVLSTRLPHGVATQRAIAESPYDGAVYFGMTSNEGHLYRYVPTTNQVEHLGQAPAGQTVWGLGVGGDGTVWFGTYPGGLLFSMNPTTREMRNHGQAHAGEQYISSILPTDDIVYVGTQQRGYLVAYDPAAGRFSDVEMPATDTDTGIAALQIRGNKLFMSSNGIHVRDLTSGQWVGHLASADARVSPVSPTDPNAVYARVAATIQRYDLVTGVLSPTGWSPNATAESWAWIDYNGTGPFLALTYWNEGRTYGRNLARRTGFYQVPALEGAGAQIIALGEGPEGAVYAGAYLSPPGMGRYDPDKQGFELLAGSGQIEGFGVLGSTLVFGRYPQGSLWQYDPARPWQLNTNPAAAVNLGDGQSRPQKFVELSSLPGTVAIASVPTGGVHGGAVSLWNPATRALAVHRHVVRDQTPVSLVEHAGILIGGTSIEGGYGIDPVTDEAVLFGFDPVGGRVLWQWAPVAGASTLTGLIIDETGHLWVIASGSAVVEIDLAAKQVVRTITVAPGYGGDRYGSAERLLFDHGRLFGVTGNSLFLIDRVTGGVVDLRDHLEHPPSHLEGLVQDRYGDLYTVGTATRLLRIGLPDDVEAPLVTARVSPANDAPARKKLLQLTANDPTARIDYQVGDGAWAVYSRPVVIGRGVSVRFRAIDPAWNSSPVQTLQL